MPIDLRCPTCQAALRFPDQAAGQPVRCPACKERIRVPHPDDLEMMPPEPTPPAAPALPRPPERVGPAGASLRPGRPCPRPWPA
jgi:hypothetical protein